MTPNNAITNTASELMSAREYMVRFEPGAFSLMLEPDGDESYVEDTRKAAKLATSLGIVDGGQRFPAVVWAAVCR